MSAEIRKLDWRSCAIIVLCAQAPGTLSAQFGSTVDVGTGPVDWDRANARVPLLNGVVRASYQTPRVLGFRPELIGTFGLSTSPTDRTAFHWDFGARVHTTGKVAEAWIGAAIGGAGAGSPSSALTRLEGGIRREFGRAGIDLWVSRTGFGAGIAPQGGLAQDSFPLDTLPRGRITDYTDVGTRATIQLGRYEAGLTLTRRLGDASIRRTGWELSATWWLAPSVGVVGSTGRSLPQFGFAVPAGRYGRVGLRMAVGATPKVRRAPPTTPERHVPNDAPRLAVAGRRLTIVWPGARGAEIMGDFTDWQPTPMVPVSSGRWIFPQALVPGVHHLNIRFDGGPWLVPAGAVPVDDGFAGRVGLVVVR